MKDKIIVEMFESSTIEGYCQSLDSANWNELKSELVMQLYKMPEDKLTEYYSKNCLIYICFTIIKRIKYGTIADTGLFYTKEKLVLEFFDDYYNLQEEYVEEKTDLYKKLESEITNLHWYHKILFEMYYKDNLTLKQIAEKTGINIKSIHYALKKTRLKLKKKLKED